LLITVTECFFRVHFAQHEDILEDLLRTLPRIDPNRPLPSGIRSILEDSGPALVLLNRVLRDPSTHYRPSFPLIQSRAAELSSLFDILFSAQQLLPGETDFRSLIAALVHFHRKETDYPRLFKFLLTLCKDSNLTKNLLKLAQPTALHYSVPYQAEQNESTDNDFGFTNSSDDEVMSHRPKTDETPLSVVQQFHTVRDQWALNLFLGGLISRSDLSLVVPCARQMRLDCDAVGSIRPSIAQLAAKRDDTPRERPPRVSYSYGAAPASVALQPFSGASACDEFALNRELVSIGCRADGENTAKSHPDVDGELSLGYVNGASEILHDIDIDADLALDCTLGLARGHIRPTLRQLLSDTYGVVGDEIFDYVKIATRPPPQIVAAMRETVVRQTANRYRALGRAFARLKHCAVRAFPAPARIPDALADLAARLPGEEPAAVRARIGGHLEGFRERIGQPFRMAFLDLVLLARFRKFYILFLEKFAPEVCLQPKKGLLDASVDWGAICERMIQKVVDARGLTQADAAVRRETPNLDREFAKAVGNLAAVGDPVADPALLPVRLVVFTMQPGDTLTLEILRLQADSGD
jgi:hypothetical protein